ncbi:hypothetical protein [Leucobacter iarius]|uniref:DUF222 domain-containing protein n=1 Tax=Leucobacter iarius TaxID=333963 RepID=A0ABN2LJP9_9MICO
MTDQLALFDAPPGPTAPESAEEAEVRAFLEALGAERELTPAERVTGRMCLALAKSIAAGNAKGRSVASDVERLMATMATLTKTDTDDLGDEDDDLTPAEKRLFDGLASVPTRNGDPANGYAEEL